MAMKTRYLSLAHIRIRYVLKAAIAFLATAFIPSLDLAAPVSTEQAETAVQNWIARDAKPLGAELGQKVFGALAYTDKAGDPLFHVVYLAEGGFVVMSADTGIQPVIAFSSGEDLDPDPANPLYAMLMQDMTAKKQALAAAAAQPQHGALAAVPQPGEGSPEVQWAELLAEEQDYQLFSSVPSVSDVRVAPLVQTKWSQSTANNVAVYNYYTPPYGEADTRNYVCGCVATAMAQLMKFHGYPTVSVTARTVECKVGGTVQNLTMKGGTYAWSNSSMPLVPEGTALSVSQRQAIGKLCYDAGVSVGMNYNTASAGGSFAYYVNVPIALKNTFLYASAVGVGGYLSSSMTENEITKCILANIDNGYPVNLGISSSSGGHAILADGYGFDGGIRYVHLNMGWAGAADVWYTLPSIGSAGGYTFTTLNWIGYNVFKDSEKKLLSGRVLNASGTPVAGASVEVRSSSGTLLQTLTSNSKGMYAFARNGTVSSETFKLRASSGGAQSAEQTVILSLSTSSNLGNLWGQNLTLDSGSGSYTVTVAASPTAGGTVTGGGTKASGSTCTVTATPNTGYAFQNWTEGTTVLSTSPSYSFTVTGNRTLTANFTASSVPLATALDNTALSWTTSGSGIWYGQVGTTHDAVDAARSGSLTHEQQSVLQTTVTGPGTLSFWWSVSSEAACDFLRFYIDGAEQSGSISGSVAWQQKSFTIPSGSHTVQWVYQKDGSVTSGSDCGWVDQVVWTPSTATYTVTTAASPTAGGTTSGGGAKTSGSSCTVTATPASGYTFVNWKENGGAVSASSSYTFTVTGDRTLTASFVPNTVTVAAALDSALTFTVGGNAGWFGQTATKYDGVDAAQSGPVGNSQASTLQTTVTGPGTLSFWWSVSSEATYDFLKFYIDGAEQSGSLSGSVAWQQKSFTISSGSHTVQWAYQKDGSASSGSDCGWVDQMTWVPTPTYYTVSSSASPAAGGTVSGGGSVASGASCTLTAAPAAGYAFQNWKESATVVSTSASYTFTVTGNRTLTANFVPVYMVSATANPSNGGTVSGGGSLVSGAACTLLATPAAGFAFQNWKEGATVVSTSPNYTFTVTGSRTLTAYFLASSIPLATALDGTALSWDASGNGYWYGQAAATHDGTDAAQSGAVTHSQSSTLQTTVTGPGTFSFWWAVSSEQDFDFLSFYVDDVSQEAISGTTVAWQQKSITLGSGAHTLKWVYGKDGSVNAGSDAGWVDQANWTPNTATYTITTVASPVAGGTTSGGGAKVVGSSCTVAAMASGGWTFSNWTEGGAVVSASPNYTFTVSANRTLTANFTASTQLPDFTVDSVVLSPTTATAGGTMTALITIRNQGSVTGTVGYVDVWLNRADVPPAGSDSDGWAQIGQLAPGAVYTLNHAFTVPQGAGTKTYRVFVDSYEQSQESNESNNQRTATYTVLAPIPLEIALDNSALAFLTGGDANWVGQSATSHDGADAAQSGGISNGQTNSLLATVTGPGTLSFWWKVSSEAGYDTLSCSIDGAVQATVSGEQAWAQRTLSIAAGTHVVRWTYAKDANEYAGSDCGWVDQVVWTPPSYTITASASPSAGGTVAGAGAKPLGSTCTLTATPNTGYTFVSWKEGSTVVSTQPVYAFTVTGARTLTANFAIVASRPDFVVQTISLSSTSVIPGASMTATITVKNQGGMSGDGGWLNVWLDRSAEAPVGSTGDGWASVGTLAAGATSTFTHTFTAPASEGSKTYRVFVDSADTTLESEESNNQRGVTYAVRVVVTSPLDVALDCEGLTWTSSGNAAWRGQSGITHDGEDAAQSGSITHSQQSVLQTAVTGSGKLTFWWSVSSEAKYDVLKFYVDGVEQAGSISGSVTWQQKSFTLPSGSHSLQWVYQKDDSVSSGSDCGWVDQVQWQQAYTVTFDAEGGSVKPSSATVYAGSTYGPLPTPARTNYLFAGWWTGDNGTGAQVGGDVTVTTAANHTLYAKWVAVIPLAEALDVQGLTWTTGGTANWYGQPFTALDGVDAARSGTITNSQQSWMQVTLTGPVTLGFWWKVSSESGYDCLSVYIDNVEQAGKISGETDWAQKYCQLAGGAHTVKWGYSKNSSITRGSDGGWVDQITLRWGEAAFGSETYTTSGEGNVALGGVRAVIPVSGVGPVSVKISAQPASATTADYTFPFSGTNLTWGVGEAGVKYVEVPIKGDTLVEGDELFYLTLENPAGGLVAEPRVCAVTIVDDDAGTVPNKGVFVAGVPLPPEGGRVTGGAYCLPGKTVSLTASPNAGWTFLNWDNGSQAPVRKVTGEQAAACAQDGVMRCTAYFKRTAEVGRPQTWSPGPQEAMVGVAFSLRLPVESECLPRLTVTGLPTGLKLDAATGGVVGVPTKAGTFIVSFTAANVAGSAPAQTFSLTVVALPDWAQGSFNGTYFKLDGAGSREESGVATMSATVLGQITGKLTFGGTNYTFSSTSYTWIEDGCLFLETAAKAGKAVIPLEINVWKLAESYATPNAIPQTLGAAMSWRDDGEMELYRNVWKDAGLAAVATNYTGYYTAVLPGGSAYGSGYLTLTVDKVGNVKASGKLADGTVVSLSGVLILNGEGNVYTVLYSAPTAYKGGCFFGLAEFVKPASGPVTVRCMAAFWSPLANWMNRSPLATDVYGAGFNRDLGLTGGWYDTVGNLRRYYTDGRLTVGIDSGAPTPEMTAGTSRYDSAWWRPDGVILAVVTNTAGIMTGLSAPKAGVPVDPEKDGMWDYSATNAVGLTVSLTRATGVFKGGFKAWFDYGATHTSKSVSYEGVLTPVREGAADGVAGRGFFLWADTATYLNLQNKPVSYAFNGSFDFLLLTAPAAE